MKNSLTKPIRPEGVRYIKLGAAGGWEKECVEKDIIRMGFGSADPRVFKACQAGRWKEINQIYIAEGKDKSTATRWTNELRWFFEDRGSLLWITFIGERLHWGVMTNDPAVPHDDGDGLWRRISGGWRWKDETGEPLTKDRLSGALTKYAAYRGTSCSVKEGKYVVGRINGTKIPEVERALSATKEMRASAVGLIQLLGPRDFELLVDLVFSVSGWRRLGAVGKAQQTLDLDLVLPSTGERAFVQVKSKTDSRELAQYIARFEDGDWQHMFFVFHSGHVTAPTDNPRVSVIEPPKLAELVVNAGLVDWLIQKVS